ncbi:MAG: zinc ABC transporter permease subunit ZnuB [Burkholderiaceae bacterium]
MFDDFFIRALLAGIGVAIIAGPLGCFIVWRRMAYYGDTLSHSALLGVALALLLNINITFAVFAVALLASLSLLALQKRGEMSADSLLGLLSHTALALGLVVLAMLSSIQIDLMGFLFGDILAVSSRDLLIIYGGGLLVLVVLGLIWQRLFAATINKELAQAEGMQPDTVNLVFMLLMAVVIAIAMKVVGVLLITALLIIPAATARRFASSPEQMAFFASLVGMVSVVIGLFSSLTWDTPSGPSIVVAASLLFVLSLTRR